MAAEGDPPLEATSYRAANVENEATHLGPIRSVSIFGASAEEEPEQQRANDEGKLLQSFNNFARRIVKYLGCPLPLEQLDVVILAGALTDHSLGPLASSTPSRWVLSGRSRAHSAASLLASSGTAAGTPAALIFRPVTTLVVEAQSASEAFERALVAVCLDPDLARPAGQAAEAFGARVWAADGVRWAVRMRRRRLDTARHEMHTHLDSRLVLLAAEGRARRTAQRGSSLARSASMVLREGAKETDEAERRADAERAEVELATAWLVEAMSGGQQAAMYRPALTSLFDFFLDKYGPMLRRGCCGGPRFAFAGAGTLPEEVVASTPLVRTRRGTKTVADVAAEWRRWLRERFSRTETPAGLLWLLWRVMIGASAYPGMLALLLLGLLCQSVLEVAVPLSLKFVVDQINAKDGTALMWTSIALAGAVVLSFAGGCMYFWAAAELASRIVRDLQNKMVKHLLSLPDLFYESTTDTQLLAHFTNDGLSFETAVVKSFDTLKSSTNLVFFAVLLFKLDARLAPAVLALQLVIINAPSFFRRRGQAASREKLRAASAVVGVAQDVVQGQDVIRQHEVQAEFMDRFMEGAEAARVHSRTFFFNSRMYLEMYIVLNSALNLAVLLAGGALVMRGWTGVAELLALHSCANKIGTAAKLVFASVPDLLRGLGGLQRVEGLLAVEPSGRVKLYDIFARSRRLIESEVRRTTMSPRPAPPPSPPPTPASPEAPSPRRTPTPEGEADPEMGAAGLEEGGDHMEKAPSTLRRLFSAYPRPKSLRLRDRDSFDKKTGSPLPRTESQISGGTDHESSSFKRARSRWRRGSGGDSEPSGGVKSAQEAFAAPHELELNELYFSPRLPDGRPAQYLSSLEAERLVELRTAPGLKRVVMAPGTFTSFVGDAAALATLGDLLLANLHSTGGRIRYGPCPAHPTVAAEWRKHVAVITEDPFIFADSVRGNVSLWDEDADDDRVVEALARAGLTDLADLNALGTAVNRRALGTSARRCLAFARALYRRPRIIILRDTSLSPQQLQVLREERAVLVQLSSRVERAEEANAVVVVADGELAELGTYAGLKATGRQFGALLRSQQSFVISPSNAASCPLERLRAMEPFAVPEPGPGEEAALAAVAAALTSESYARGQLLCREGDPARRFFLVAAGTVAVTQVNLDGTVRRCGVLQPSDYFWVAPAAPASPRESPLAEAPSNSSKGDGRLVYRHTLEATAAAIVLTMDAGQLLAALTPRMRRHAAGLAAARRARARWKVAREKIGGVASFLSVLRVPQAPTLAPPPGGPGAPLPAAVELRPVEARREWAPPAPAADGTGEAGPGRI